MNVSVDQHLMQKGLQLNSLNGVFLSTFMSKLYAGD